MSYDYSQILLPGNCYVSPYAIGLPVTDYGYSCASRFYCPNATSSVTKSLPQLCSATAGCVATRLKTSLCTPQGPYEPSICPPGYYCPDPKTIYQCPEGSWCPTGTSVPRTCPSLSSCPVGTVAPKYYGGIVICAIVDFVLVVLYVGVKYRQRGVGNVLKRVFGKGGQVGGGGRKKRSIDGVVAGAVVPEDVINIGVPDDKEDIGEDGLSPDDVESSKRNRQPSAQPETVLGRISVNEILGKNLQKADSEGELGGFMQDFRTALDGKEDVFIDFDFRDLGLRLKEGKTILKGVNGMIRSKKLTAIMGPSGCGKTTFMSVLMGKVARTSGKLLINNDECEMSKYKKIIGYVPQEDIMLRELTVRENIYHSARVRLPNNWTGVQVNKFVDNVLEVLNLTHVQHNLIGSESERGISGGQRKRVNIGMELAGVPIALFLDEPTSGLDSTSSLKVAEILRKIASLGLTVVSVIHQPRYEIFQQFNDLLMLVPGGKTAYIGPTCFVVEYFKELGYFFDALANPADILMDILSGKGIHLRDEHITSDGLVEKWESFGKSWVDAKIAAGEKEDHTLHTPEECTASTRDLEGIVKKRGSSIFTQIALCHNRYLIQQYRRAGSLAIEIGVASLAGGLMGIAIMGQDGMIFKGVIVAPYEALTPSTITWLIPQLGLLIGMACSLAGAPAGVKVFAEEQTVYWREAANGHNKAAYFTGKALSSIYRFVLSSLHFTAIFAVLGLPSAPFEFIYACILLQFWCVYGLAMVVSMIVRREDSALLAVVVCLFSAVFCGYGPTIKDSYSMGITFIFHMSYNRWATEAWFSKELSIFEGVYKIEDAAEGFGYVLNKEGMNLLLCFVIGVVLRAKAFALMVLLHRDKQK